MVDDCGGGGYISVEDMICWTEGLRVGVNVPPPGEQGKVRYSYCGKISSYIGACIERIPALM